MFGGHAGRNRLAFPAHALRFDDVLFVQEGAAAGGELAAQDFSRELILMSLIKWSRAIEVIVVN